jgi:hypothetical protein
MKPEEFCPDDHAVIEELSALDGRVIFFPVRHHSPAAARVIRQLILDLRPAAVLIEGPSDFNARLQELYLPHRLPLAIYSYVRWSNDVRHGAYYPFCIYSPEWLALMAGKEVGAEVRFIDLPYAEADRDDDRVNLYGDREFQRSGYVATLCRELGVEDFDGLWDTLFELPGEMSAAEYMKRCHRLCVGMRIMDPPARRSDVRREAFMAREIRDAMSRTADDKLVVVTGGYHSLALWSAVFDKPMSSQLTGDGTPGCQQEEASSAPAITAIERGIALTPYSYERLDSLRGYEAGMPNPGFYHQVWRTRQQGTRDPHRGLLAETVKTLRERKQPISAADLIAAETTAQALARLRGHDEVWRGDLVDGLAGALIKDDLARGNRHPLLDAVHQVLRGGERGELAAGAELPPLIHDLRRLLEQYKLSLTMQPFRLELELTDPEARAKSCILHQICLLGISGFKQTGGTDFSAREDLSRLWEEWQLCWVVEYDSSAIEAARYGATLAEAAAASLLEQAKQIERDAARAAKIMLQAALAGLESIGSGLTQLLLVLIRQDGDFLSVASALGHLLYLFQYDEVLAKGSRNDAGAILKEAFDRSLWLLEGFGHASAGDHELLQAVRQMIDTFERCEGSLALNRDEVIAVLTRVQADRGKSPSLRGAATGALFALGKEDIQGVTAEMKLFADPVQLGDFLTGVFALAREIIQKNTELLLAIDAVIHGYDDDDFLAALPALRLAFTYFTPREKHYMAVSLRRSIGGQGHALAELSITPQAVAEAMAFEGILFGELQKYGLRRGGRP